MTGVGPEVVARAVELLRGAGELHARKEFAAALSLADSALALAPGLAAVHFQRGLILAASRRHADALVALQAADALQPGDPWNACEQGMALLALQEWGAALHKFDEAIRILPTCAPAWTGRGQVFTQLLQFDTAAQQFGRAVALAPGLAQAHWDLALSALLLGDYATGWAEYEWRWKTPELGTRRRTFTQPVLTAGTPLAGRTLLLYPEQGLGDTLQFCRYALLARDAGARVVLEAQPALARLLQRSLPGVQVVAAGSELPPFDVQCALLSAPLAFGTRVESIPWPGPYLRADPARVSHWAQRLGTGRPRVGLAWSGNPGHRRDAERSVPLADLLAHLPPGPHYVSLQRDLRAGDDELLAQRSDVLHAGPELRDFDDTAALAVLMDRIISVDTSVAHLAGALGRPVDILTCAWPDWRWLLRRADTPWYPSARLLRQAARGQWGDVLQRVHASLANPAP